VNCCGGSHSRQHAGERRASNSGKTRAGHASLFDWNAATPWWISSFVPNLEAELGLALMFASMIPTLPWARLFAFAALLVFGTVTLAWWGFLTWLIWRVI
jgi:hypothetical protein